MKTRSSNAATSIIDTVLHTTLTSNKDIKRVKSNTIKSSCASHSKMNSSTSYFLIKAEPNSRIENKVDVKVDIFHIYLSHPSFLYYKV